MVDQIEDGLRNQICGWENFHSVTWSLVTGTGTNHLQTINPSTQKKKKKLTLFSSFWKECLRTQFFPIANLKQTGQYQSIWKCFQFQYSKNPSSFIYSYTYFPNVVFLLYHYISTDTDLENLKNKILLKINNVFIILRDNI